MAAEGCISNPPESGSDPAQYDGSECGPVGSKAPADPHTQPFEDG